MTSSVISCPLSCLLLSLKTLLVLGNGHTLHCPLFQKSSVYRDGDLVLDGFFTLYALKAQNIEHISFIFKPNRSSADVWHWDNYQYVLAFLFAIEEINKNTHLLPNVTLGFSIYNALNSDHKTLENILLWFSGGKQKAPNYNCQKHRNSIAIIAETISEFFVNTGPLLELYKVPQRFSNAPKILAQEDNLNFTNQNEYQNSFVVLIQITCGRFDSLLSNKHQFPSLYQMGVKDNSLVLGVIRLLQNFNWNWVVLFVSDDIQGEEFSMELEAEMLNKVICITKTIKFPPLEIPYIDYSECFELWHKNVSILYDDADIFIKLYRYESKCEPVGMMWILVTKSYINLNKIRKMDWFNGNLYFSHQKRNISELGQFLETVNPYKYQENSYLFKCWLDIFPCSFFLSLCKRHNECPSNASLSCLPGNTDMMPLSEPSYNIYNVVHVVARALHDMLLEKELTELTRDAMQAVLLPWKLHPFLRNIQFTNAFGDHISLDEKRISSKQYDILNILPFPAAQDFVVKVGEFIYNGPNNQNFTINEDIIEWPVKWKKQAPQAFCTQSCASGFKKVPYGSVICCFSCASCSKGEISDKTDAQECFLCSDLDYPNQESSACLPKSVTFLAFEDHLGMALACTAVGFSVLTLVVLWIFVKHQDTPIVKANNRALSYTLLICLLLCFLCSLLFIGHPNIVTCILQQVTFGIVFTVAVSSVLAKTITVILAFRAMKPGRTVRWLLVSGGSNSVVPICTLIQVVICGVWLGTSPPFIDIDSHSDPTQLILMCNKGSITAFYCVLGYLGSLALLSFCLSYQVRNLPDTFNEAKFLTFSMLVFCSIWVTFLPVYHSARGKVMVTLEVFSILASSAGLLVCIFAPKCYIILRRPAKNTLKSLRNKVDYKINA